MKMLLALGMLLFSTSAFAECSWDDPDCVADDIDETVEGTWIEPIVKPVTDEIRDTDDDDD